MAKLILLRKNKNIENPVHSDTYVRAVPFNLNPRSIAFASNPRTAIAFRQRFLRDGLERSRFRNAWRSTKRRAWLPPARRANVLSVNSAESIYTPWNFESDSRHARVGASPQEIARLEPALGWKERATVE